MRARAAVLYEVHKPVVVEDVEVLEPGSHEVLVRWAANGVCHSDYHVITGDYPHPLPVVLGHEAAGVVERVGAAVETVKPGDHVCSSYIPSCGKCRYCINGQPTLCALRDRPRWFMMDGTPRFRRNGQPLHHFLQVSGYATHAVLPEESVIPVRKDAPLDVVCLVSCGVLAGAGPVFNRARVPPGRQRRRLGLRRRRAQHDPGRAPGRRRADHRRGRDAPEARVGGGVRRHPRRRRLARRIPSRGSRRSAAPAAWTSRSRWSAPQKTIEQALLATRRGGTCVAVGVCPAGTRLSIDPMLFLQQRTLTGSSFGAGHQRTDVPMLIDLYMSGQYRIEELISRRVGLDELNHAFDLMLQGEVKRSVVVYQ